MTTTDHAAALAVLDKITPGPWTARLNGSETAYYIKGADGIHVGGMSWHATDRRYYTLQDESRINARAIAALPELAALYRAAHTYRQSEMDYVFMAERPDEEYVAADVHLARMHMHRAATAFDAALAAVAAKLTGEGK